jgi:hypothetical protein
LNLHRRINLVLIMLLPLVLAPVDLLCQDPVTIQHLTGSVNFDGRPDEEAWNSASVFPLIVHSPNYGTDPFELSDVRIAYDQQYLWIGARLYSKDPGNISATSKKRDEESRNSDSFGIILDTYNDNENALAFFTMPTGARIDYTVSNDAEGGGGGAPGRGSINQSWNLLGCGDHHG